MIFFSGVRVLYLEGSVRLYILHLFGDIVFIILHGQFYVRSCNPSYDSEIVVTVRWYVTWRS